MSFDYNEVVAKVADTLVRAGSTFREDKKEAYRRAIASEELTRAKWNLETILENAEVAQCNRSPLCDDTGIPHVFIEIGPNRTLSGSMMTAIQEGVLEGLRQLPGRPMAIMGDDAARIDMSGGISPDSDALVPAPFLIKEVEEDVLRVHVLMLGGGPAIRGITHRVFHKHSLQVVLDETRRLTKLVSDLLKLSRYESGKVPLNIVRFDINELVCRSIIAFGARLDEKNVDVHVDLPGGECYVMADEDRISQVLVNLTDNALKFLPEAGGRLEISVVPGAREAQIRIADNGPGIAQEDLPHIFDRFYKADKAHTVGKGTGLGLAIVAQVVEDHNGSIQIESTPGEGTAFRISLPRLSAQT